MLWLNTSVVSPFDPSLKVAKNKMDHWQMRLGLIWVAPKD